jgi:hypothetical protein
MALFRSSLVRPLLVEMVHQLLLVLLNGLCNGNILDGSNVGDTANENGEGQPIMEEMNQ